MFTVPHTHIYLWCRYLTHLCLLKGQICTNCRSLSRALSGDVRQIKWAKIIYLQLNRLWAMFTGKKTTTCFAWYGYFLPLVCLMSLGYWLERCVPALVKLAKHERNSAWDASREKVLSRCVRSLWHVRSLKAWNIGFCTFTEYEESTW